MTGDVAQTKKYVAKWGHMNTPCGIALVFTSVCARVSVRVCAHVCAHVCARVTRKFKLPFQYNHISLCHLHLIYALIFIISSMWGFVLF